MPRFFTLVKKILEKCVCFEWNEISKLFPKDKMFELSKGEVYDFYLKDKNYKNFSKTELAEKILFELGLLIKSENEIAELVRGSELLSSAITVVMKRLWKLVGQIKSRKTGLSVSDPIYSQVFFDLRHFPELIKEDESSQEYLSQSSRVSNLSDLEIEIPSQPRKKRSFPFTEVGPKAKTIRTKEVFELLLETAERENLSPGRLAAYLGYRVSY